MRPTSALVAASFALWVGVAPCGEPVGIQTYSFPIDIGSYYFSCLGDVVSISGTIHVRFHQLETKSGVVHILDNWRYEYVATGQSGREWFSIGGYKPGQSNIVMEKGRVEQWRFSLPFRPLTEDTPGFILHNHQRVTVNANGEITASVDPHNVIDDIVKCVGPK